MDRKRRRRRRLQLKVRRLLERLRRVLQRPLLVLVLVLLAKENDGREGTTLRCSKSLDLERMYSMTRLRRRHRSPSVLHE